MPTRHSMTGAFNFRSRDSGELPILGSDVESNARFYRRRANEELAAASRAVTPAARDRRINMAKRFLDHLDDDEAQELLFDWGMVAKERHSLRAEDPVAH